MKLEPLMATLNELQISSCKLLYVADVPINYSDAVQLVIIFFSKTQSIKLNLLL